jgi:hypothetical protein
LQKILECNPVAPRSKIPALPLDMEVVCLKCLEKNPADRYPSAAQLADDLEKFAAGESVSVRPAALAERAFKWAKRRPTAAAAWALGVTASGLLIFGGTVLWLWTDAKAAKRTAETSLSRESDARQAEAEATRQADEARGKLAEFERSRRRERAQAAKDSVIAQLPDLRRRALWPQALSLLSQTKALLESDSDVSVMDQLASAESDIQLLAELDEIRMRKAAHAAANPKEIWTSHDIREKYKITFRRAGYDFSGNDKESVISAASQRLAVSAIQEQLIVALDDWAWFSLEDYEDTIWQTTSRVTGAKWRMKFKYSSVMATAKLSHEVPIEQLTPSIVCGIGLIMRGSSKGRDAINWLEAGAKHFPADFWVNFYLGTEYQRLEENESAAGAFRAALAIRPDAPLARKCLDQCLKEIETRRR